MARTTSNSLDLFRDSALEVCLLPMTAWDHALAIQQRLVYEMSEEPRKRAALILCEHPPIITIGRQGSRQHIRLDEDELRANRIEMRWTNRGGGCWLQIPGQLAIYPVLPLEPRSLGLEAYRACLYQTITQTLAEFGIVSQRDDRHTGVVVGEREIASVGVAVKSWVAYHGCRLNVCVPLHRFDWVQSNPLVDRKMTCMFRERRLPIRTDAVRESFVRHFVSVFGFANYYLCNPPPVVSVRRPANVTTGNY